MEKEETPPAAAPQVSLKNGGQIEAKLGLALLDYVRYLLAEEPQHFKTLLAIAQGKSMVHATRSIRYLQDWLYLRQDGSLDPDTRNILLSSYLELREGPVLVNPFALATTGEAQRLESEMEADDEKWRRIIGRITGRDRSP